MLNGRSIFEVFFSWFGFPLLLVVVSESDIANVEGLRRKVGGQRVSIDWAGEYIVLVGKRPNFGTGIPLLRRSFP